MIILRFFKDKLNNRKIILIIYICLSLVLNRIFIKIEFLNGIVSILHLFLMPYFIGALFYNLFLKLIKINDRRELLLFSKIIICWVIGLFFIILIALILQILNLFSILLFSIINISLYIISVIYNKENLNFELISKKKTLIFILVLIISLAPLIILKISTGFPGSYSVVIYRFNYISESIIQRNTIILDEMTQYFPIFPIIISTISYIFKVGTFTIFWFGSFIIEIIFFCGIYTCINIIFKNYKYALFCSLISLYILIWNPNFLFPPIYELQPRSITYALFPIFFILILQHYYNLNVQEKHKTEKDIGGSCFLIINYIIVFFTMILTKHSEISNRGLSLSVILILLLLSNLIILKFIKTNKFDYLNIVFFFIIFPLIHTNESVYYIVVIFILIALKYFEKLLERNLKDKEISFLFLIINIFLFLFLILLVSGIIKINSIVFSLFDTIVDINPNVNYSNNFNELINSITLPIFALLCLGILISLYKKENNLINKQLSLTFIVLILFYSFPISDIVRIGGAFIIFILYFTIISVEFILRLIDKWTKSLA